MTLTLKVDPDHDILPLKMCGFLRCTYMPNFKTLSAIAKKSMANVKVGRKPTSKQTQGKNDMSPSIDCMGDIKII